MKTSQGHIFRASNETAIEAHACQNIVKRGYNSGFKARPPEGRCTNERLIGLMSRPKRFFTCSSISIGFLSEPE